MIRRLLLSALALAATAASLWYLVKPGSLSEVTTAMSGMAPSVLVIAFALSAAVQWLRAWRFAIMTRGSLAFPDATLVAIAFQLNFFNFVVPFRLGELSYPVLMRRAYDQSFLEAAGVLILARLFDLASVLAIFLFMAALLRMAGGASPLLYLAATVLAGVPALLILLGRAALALPGLGKFAAPLAAGLDSLRQRPAQLAAIALSFAIWLAYGVMAVLVARATTATVGPAQALLAAAASNVAFALPINGVAGLGPAQAAWVFIVTKAQVPWHDAVVSALAVYGVSLASALVFGGIAALAAMPRAFGRRVP
jgi:uncharacterized membrane protein YbhN (UPF0104 family)